MTPRHAVFRADASPSIGTGHVVRCRTLAEALLQRGWTATLATRDLPLGLARSVRDAGIGIIELAPTTAPLDEGDAIDRATAGPISLLVADHYDLDSAWFESARDLADVMMAIDDLADRAQSVDLLLNQNLGTDIGQYDGLVPSDALVLTGPRYAIVRPEFGELRARGRVRTGRVARILVFISGADPDDVTSRTVAALSTINAPVDVVVGAAYAHVAALRAVVDRQPTMELHVNVDTMAELMDRADLAIGAPSSASWERCTLGLPTVLIAVAETQLEVARLLVECGAAVSVGWHATASPAIIRAKVTALMAEPERIAGMSQAAAAVTDGRGTDRVVAEIERLIMARTEAT